MQYETIVFNSRKEHFFNTKSDKPKISFQGKLGTRRNSKVEDEFTWPKHFQLSVKPRLALRNNQTKRWYNLFKTVLLQLHGLLTEC